MENGGVGGGLISGFRRSSEDHVEVTCGCTSHHYGDAVGTLRVFLNGDLQISCQCTPGCQEGLIRAAREIPDPKPRLVGHRKLANSDEIIISD